MRLARAWSKLVRWGMNGAGEQIDKDTFATGAVIWGTTIYGGIRSAYAKAVPESSSVVKNFNQSFSICRNCI